MLGMAVYQAAAAVVAGPSSRHATSSSFAALTSSSLRTGVVTGAEAALRWLGAKPPNLDEVRKVLGQIVKDGMRAGEVIQRIRALIKKTPPRMARVDVNEAVLDVTTLTQNELLRHGVSLQTRLAAGLPLVFLLLPQAELETGHARRGPARPGFRGTRPGRSQSSLSRRVWPRSSSSSRVPWIRNAQIALGIAHTES